MIIYLRFFADTVKAPRERRTITAGASVTDAQPPDPETAPVSVDTSGASVAGAAVVASTVVSGISSTPKVRRMFLFDSAKYLPKVVD